MAPARTRNLLPARLLALAVAGLLAAGAWAFSTGEELARWMSTYYQAPEPQRLGEAVSRFVAEPHRLARPERLDAPTHFFAVVARSGAPARQSLAAFGDTLPAGAQKQFVDRVLNHSGKIEFARARDPNDLDVLWAHFAATGSVEAARMVLAALDFQEQEVDLARPVWKAIKITDKPEAARLVRSAAAWSLSRHAQGHPRVRDLLEKELAAAKSEPRRAQLRGILDGRIDLK